MALSLQHMAGAEAVPAAEPCAGYPDIAGEGKVPGGVDGTRPAEVFFYLDDS